MAPARALELAMGTVSLGSEEPLNAPIAWPGRCVWMQHTCWMEVWCVLVERRTPVPGAVHTCAMRKDWSVDHSQEVRARSVSAGSGHATGTAAVGCGLRTQTKRRGGWRCGRALCDVTSMLCGVRTPQGGKLPVVGLCMHTVGNFPAEGDF